MPGSRHGKYQDALRYHSEGRPGKIEVVVPEGYASHGLYPETYLRASEHLREDWQGVLITTTLRNQGGIYECIQALVLKVALSDRLQVVAEYEPREPAAARESAGVCSAAAG